MNAFAKSIFCDFFVNLYLVRMLGPIKSLMQEPQLTVRKNLRSRIYRFALSNPSLLLACIMILTIIVYWPVFSHQFQTNWDDFWVVINPYTDEGFDPDNIKGVLRDFYCGQYAPVNELYYIVLHSLFGYSTFWFHLAGLVVHCLNIYLAYQFVKKLLAVPTCRLSYISKGRILFLSTFLFAIHPFLTEAVNWTAASKIILYALFYFLGLNYYLRFLATRKWYFYLATLLCYILSFGAKEQAVTMSVCCFLLDLYWGRKMSTLMVYLEKIPLFAMSAVFGVITIYSQAAARQGMLTTAVQYPIRQRLLLACYTYVQYLSKCLLPLQLNFCYPFPFRQGQPVPLFLNIFPVILGLIIFALWHLRKNRFLMFGMAFFTIHILLVLNILPMSRVAVVADRYVYVAALGITFMLGYLFDVAIRMWRRQRKWLAMLSFVYMLWFGIYAHQRCTIWHSDNTLKAESLEKSTT